MNATHHRSAWLRGGLVAFALAAGAVQAAEMSVFKQPNFTGDALTLHGDNPNLAANGFQDQISSLVINSGRWEVCSQPNFQGDCAVLERGQYPALEQRLNHRIESVREVSRLAGRGYGDRDRYAYNDYRGGPAVELFDGPGFRGRRVPVGRDQDDLVRRNFDQQASSMVIHEGTWQICTQPGYEGVCRVFREGEYPDLRRFDNRIGSLKRVG
ncbi:MAG TPA: beta/gamma crystallin-related protein [Usitatibacter sp.]|nr:beta/gamma crystallin-related protein [Usitatibacter sp.]